MDLDQYLEKTYHPENFENEEVYEKTCIKCEELFAECVCSSFELYEVKINVPSWVNPAAKEIVRATSEANARWEIEQSFVYNRQPFTITSITLI
jgi:hypothetical protein